VGNPEFVNMKVRAKAIAGNFREKHQPMRIEKGEICQASLTKLSLADSNYRRNVV